MVVALLALVVALGGTAVAGIIRSKGDTIIKRHSLSGNRLKNHTITGTQINLSKLGTVPNAAFANAAGSANNSNTLGGAGPSAYAASAQQGFIAATLNAGWSNFHAADSKAGYMKDSLGFVHLSGTINCGTGTAFTLPVGYRPALNQFLPAATSGGGDNVFLSSAGEVEPVCKGAVEGLDGVIFPAAGTAGTAPVSHASAVPQNPNH